MVVRYLTSEQHSDIPLFYSIITQPSSSQREDNTYSPPAQASVPAVACAVACAVRALAVDRRAGRAWALLASLVQPRARREYCRAMAQTVSLAVEII